MVQGAELHTAGWISKRPVQTFWEHSPGHCRPGKGLDSRAQTEMTFTFPASRTGEQHSLEPGGRDDGEHRRKVDGLSDTPSGLKDPSLL